MSRKISEKIGQFWKFGVEDMSTEELHRHDGGPLERSHMKDMVQRNALENAAYHKVAKHLESQKKAFVRQNTRDEGEMKNLLCRLQMEQQTALHDTDTRPGEYLFSNYV